MTKQIILKAVKDAPQAVGAGNFFGENRSGKFTTESREFADYLIAQGFAEETPEKPIEPQQQLEGATN